MAGLQLIYIFKIKLSKAGARWKVRKAREVEICKPTRHARATAECEEGSYTSIQKKKLCKKPR